MSRQELLRDARRLIRFDEAIAKLQQAGLSEEFINAIENDPELLKALDRMAPSISAAASNGWSCCVTVSNPLPTAEYRAIE